MASKEIQQQLIDAQVSILDKIDDAENAGDMQTILRLSDEHIETCQQLVDAGGTVDYDEHGVAYWTVGNA